MRITEVDGGTASDPNADFVELKMYSPDQIMVSGHMLRFYAANGSFTDYPISGSVANGMSQATILFATSQAAAAHGVAADFEIMPLIDPAGGAVCFENIDCVAWGTFSAATPSPAGTSEPGGIPADQSLHRCLGTDGVLQAADDRNDSAADFFAAAPSPTNNTTINHPPVPCTPEAIGQPPPGETPPGEEAATLQGLKAKVKGGKATIKGQVVNGAPGEKVKLIFFANGSPLKKVATKSAQLDQDSRFKKRFGVPSEATRCRVNVKFAGELLGKKRFAC